MALDMAYALPHPPLAIEDVGRGQERAIAKTLEAYGEVSAEIARIAPEAIVFITPHSVMYSDYFHISPGAGASGDFTRFRAPGVRFEAKYDEELAREISTLAAAYGIPAGPQGEKDPRLDHGVTVPMWFINKQYANYRAVRISQSGLEPSAHYKLGMAIAEAAEKTGRKTVLVASSDLSHKLKEDGPYGYAPEGPSFDEAAVRALEGGEFLTLMKMDQKLREKAAECGYGSLMALAGAFDGRGVLPRVLSYEGPFGVGYAVASFAPGRPDPERNILERFELHALSEARRKQESEDSYRALARMSLEHRIKTGAVLKKPAGLPAEMENGRAGVFVSLHRNGSLRGCIGTISPATGCIAEEIIQNAVSAGLRDTRFDPVAEGELPYLTYKVDVLSPPEPIESSDELDVRKYGVIVTSGHKRGLLLPNLDGVDTVAEQLEIARKKAGIGANEKYALERFEVIRYE